jgi:hypothetical protein
LRKRAFIAVRLRPPGGQNSATAVDAEVFNKFCEKIFEATADDSKTTSTTIDHASLATRQQSLSEHQVNSSRSQTGYG